jgi:hypothetical protein
MAKFRVHDDGWGYFHCPGCNRIHWLRVKLETNTRAHPKWEEHPIWNWNGDVDKPALNPSMRYAKEEQCHAMVEEGLIWFYRDCTHQLAGQVVELPELTEER